MRMAQARRWRAVTLNFRSCSGELNRRPQFYHSGHTDDLEDVLALVLAREPATRLLAVGISLGGNVLLKWLGQRRAGAPPRPPRPRPTSLPHHLRPRAGFPRRGGHAGFIEGRWPWRVGSWAERRAVEFLAGVLAEPPGIC